MLKKLLPRLAAAFGLAPQVLGAAAIFSAAWGQVPPPVPALPDSERRTQYSISASTCACAVGFALFGSGTDVDSWIEVWVAGTRYLSTDVSHGWSLSSATGTLGTIPRPITNAVLTFTAVQTGVVQIVGANRPRRLSQFQNNQPVAARDLNVVVTDITAQNRETWDKLNDVTGRAVVGQPGDVFSALPSAVNRAGKFLSFDGSGNPTVGTAAPGAGIGGPGTSVVGEIALFNNLTGSLVKDATGFSIGVGGPLALNPTSGTANQGFVVTQTGPAGATSGPLIFNNITVNNPSAVTTPALGGSCATGCTNGMANAEARGFHVDMNDSSASTIASAGSFHMVVNSGTPAGDKVGVISNIYVNKSVSGFALALDAVAAVDTGGSVPVLSAAQFETAFYGSGSATSRFGIEITNDTSTQGGTDAAIAIDNAGTNAGAFFNAIMVGSSADLAMPLAIGGNFINVLQFGGSNVSIADFCHCANFTVTGNIFNFPNFSIANTNNQNAPAILTLTNSGVGTNVQSEVLLSNGTNTLSASIGGVNSTFGSSVYNARGYLTANGTALVVGTSASNPYIVVINNVEAGRFDSGTPGQLDLGVSGTLAGALQLLNATSGNITLRPPTGALGSGNIITVPALTGVMLTTSASSGQVTTATNSLGSDTLLNNTGTYFDGPSAANATAGTWFASGTVTLTDTGGAFTGSCKLWDGTTVIDSGKLAGFGAANMNITMSLSGTITTPAANIRISCIDTAATTGKIVFNASGNSKDSTVTAIRTN